MTNNLLSYLDGYVQIYRHGRLVYLPTLKCASTFYRSLFQFNQWETQSILDIDWKQDHVFSFIMNPTERRLKGLAEFITMIPDLQGLLEITEIWPKISYLDFHSTPYSLCYKNLCHKIDWIPIDHPEFKSEDLVKILLSDNNISLDWSTNDFHRSTDDKKEIYNKIKVLSGQCSGEVYMSLEDDIILYDNVCRSIQFYEKTWNDISWLRNVRNKSEL